MLEFEVEFEVSRISLGDLGWAYFVLAGKPLRYDAHVPSHSIEDVKVVAVCFNFSSKSVSENYGRFTVYFTYHPSTLVNNCLEVCTVASCRRMSFCSLD